MSDLDIPRTHDGPPEDSSASVAADKYDQMLALADLFDTSGNEMRTRARLGAEILADDDVAPVVDAILSHRRGNPGGRRDGGSS